MKVRRELLMSKIVAIIILVVCVLLSGFFSGSEIAFAKVNQHKLKRESEKKGKESSLAYEMAVDYKTTLNTVLISNNLVNILASSVATILFVSLIDDDALAETLATIVMTVIILIFGEILPKAICQAKSYSVSKAFAIPLKFFSIIFFPFIYICNKVIEVIAKIFTKKEELDDDVLYNMVDDLEERGVIDEDQQELISNAIDFIDVEAMEVMQHRMDVFAFDINDDINDLINDKNLLNYSRIPVYDETIDNVVGILNSKQLLKMHLNGDKIDIREILTEPLYVFQTQPVSSILKSLKKDHIHLAVVKDEFGGTLGILTLEDILEELVGEILDEKDEEEMEEYHKVNKNKFTVDGAMNLYDFFDLVEYDYEDNEYVYSTVGGWITDELGKFPDVGDNFDFNHHHIKVIRADEFTVKRVSVEKILEEENQDEE